MKHLRIALSVLMVALLMAGMFTGCKNDTATPDASTSADNTESNISRNPVGSFVINGGAIIELSYNAEGLVVDAVGKNSAGITIMDAEPQIFGISCKDAVVTLLPHLNAVNNLQENNYAVLLKSTPDSKEPSETFMTEIGEALEQAASNQGLSLKVFALSCSDLNAHGEITPTQARNFLLAVLAYTEDSFDSLIATAYPVDGSYAFQIITKHLQEDYLVNALNGDIMEGSVDESFFDISDTDIEIELPEGIQDEEDPSQDSGITDIEIELPL